jgi:hypothetical protein
MRSDAMSLVQWLLSLYDRTVLRRFFPGVFYSKHSLTHNIYKFCGLIVSDLLTSHHQNFSFVGSRQAQYNCLLSVANRT